MVLSVSRIRRLKMYIADKEKIRIIDPAPGARKHHCSSIGMFQLIGFLFTIGHNLGSQGIG